MPALEPLAGVRVVAHPAALDRAAWLGGNVIVMRIAPDEAFGIGATGAEVADSDAIIEPERGFVGGELTHAELAEVVRHVEWPLPAGQGILAQGKVAGVPARVLTGEPALLVTQAAYADDLASRLGWLS